MCCGTDVCTRYERLTPWVGDMATISSASFRVADVRAQDLCALHRRFATPLRRFFRRYRLNAADVEDLTQDVFVRLAGSNMQVDLLKPESFVFTVALNLVRDRARRLHIKALPKSMAVEKCSSSCDLPTPDQCLEFEQRLRHAEQLLSGLKPDAQEAFSCIAFRVRATYRSRRSCESLSVWWRSTSWRLWRACGERLPSSCATESLPTARSTWITARVRMQICQSSTIYLSIGFPRKCAEALRRP